MEGRFLRTVERAVERAVGRRLEGRLGGHLHRVLPEVRVVGEVGPRPVGRAAAGCLVHVRHLRALGESAAGIICIHG